MPATRHIQRVVHTEDLVGESPIWCPQEQALYWVDVRGCWLHRWEPETGLRHDWPMPDVIGCIALREGGGLLVAQGVSLCTFDTETGALEVFATLEEGRSDLRINDGACDPQGRIWVGTMTHNFGGPGGSD
ncbi:MAG: SMP-30/gluconolactonase/LRE family protein, partial [Myxococcota bacterium]